MVRDIVFFLMGGWILLRKEWSGYRSEGNYQSFVPGILATHFGIRSRYSLNTGAWLSSSQYFPSCCTEETKLSKLTGFTM